jgi:glycosyltransferase involved in cell wall biosynthesis
MVRNTYPDVKVVKLSENFGYAGNNNVGSELELEYNAEWIFFVNKETVIHKSTGRLVERNPRSFGEAIWLLFEDRVLVELDGTNLRKHFLVNWSWDIATSDVGRHLNFVVQ